MAENQHIRIKYGKNRTGTLYTETLFKQRMLCRKVYREDGVNYWKLSD